MEDGNAHSHSMATKAVHSGERLKPRVSGEPAEPVVAGCRRLSVYCAPQPAMR